MPSERVQRHIERLLEETDQALAQGDWDLVQAKTRDILALDPDNGDARTFLAAFERRQEGVPPLGQATPAAPASSMDPAIQASVPTAFAAGRYEVKRHLGEGGKKRVYLAHDTLLDRDVAFALIKTEGLDDTGRDRIRREAQAMGRLGSHPHIVSVFDLGEEADGQPYIVTELMGGGDVEGQIEKAPDHRPPLERSLEIGIQVCRGLEFAHSHDIVHRDLKPGNVWLTADGTAKLGDFGLAVALDRSRLTQAGMMVGTVSYMPPEQAMGGEVTPRSDLYSLGAMLYEMVTGRPPFVGDESVAIITQHLNTAPVSPSWHNSQTPAALEALILRLLEKDPSKRPESAADVLKAIESLKGSISAPMAGTDSDSASAGSEPAAENPMYRRTFVGRESELHTLQASYDAALSGQGSLVMVVGEPGIGKTSVCEQLTTFATVRGGKTLIGHCYEEGSLSLPYLPFVEAMRSYVLAREPDGLKSDLGSGAGEVARIVSEIRDRLQVELPPAGAPEDDRWRLLQAVTSFLRNASTVQPLVIVLEDLHDADRGTLDLLVHLSRNLAGARLLIVGTYRDVEVDRSHPLSSTLAELRRSQNFTRVPLRGLTAEEVQRMMAGVSQQDVPWPMAEVVHRQTEGNPLFVQEMLRYLVEEGLVERREGTLRRVGEETLAGRIPEGLRDVIGKRLSRLADKTNQVLAVASVMGREFRLDVLQAVANLPQDEIEQALEQACALAVVEQRQATGTLSFRFTHAFFRQTLYEEIFVPRRIRWHQQVGRALEIAYGRRVEEHAAELAEHFVQSTEHDDLRKALEYCEVAAKRAMGVYAYGEAVRHLEQALKVQEVLDPDDREKRCDLLLALGDALLPGGDPQRVYKEAAAAALKLAESLGDDKLAARCCGLALDGLFRFGAGAMPYSSEWAEWAERGDRHAALQTVERVHVNLALSALEVSRGRVERGWQLGQSALALARQLNDDEMLFRSAAIFCTGLWSPLHEEERRLISDEFSKRSRAGVSATTLGLFLAPCAFVYVSWGDRARAEECGREVSAMAERTQDNVLVGAARIVEILLATLDGMLEKAVEKGEGRIGFGDASLGAVPGANRAHRFAVHALLYLGRAQEAMTAVSSVAEVAQQYSLAWRARLVLCLAQLGRVSEASEGLRQLLIESRARINENEMSTAALSVLLQAAIALEDGVAASLLVSKLVGLASMPAYASGTECTCIARHLGAASALLKDRDQALAYYQQALEVAGKARFRPEIALTHLGLAELLLDGSDRARRATAIDHLNLAISEFREMKMQPSLERALRHKEVLKA